MLSLGKLLGPRIVVQSRLERINSCFAGKRKSAHPLGLFEAPSQIEGALYLTPF